MNYTKIYNNLIEFRLKNKYIGYTEKHHILPRSLGGSDDKENIVELSAREHYICHLLLTKMYEYGSSEYFKMLNAYIIMSFGKSDNHKRNYKINSRCYEKLRIEYSKYKSLTQTGNMNSQYGTCWITNGIDERKVDKNHQIETGWKYGRTKLPTKPRKRNYVKRDCNKYLNFNGVIIPIHKRSFFDDDNLKIFISEYRNTNNISSSLKSINIKCSKPAYEKAKYIIKFI